MKLFKWTGPLEDAGNLPEEARAILLNNDEEVLVLQEAETTHLENAVEYEVMDHSGDLPSGRFAVLNNVPVSEDGREIFEQRFSNRARLIEAEPGFVAIRVLRPVESDTYVILTMWDDEESFTAWQSSQAYGKAHAKRGTDDGVDKRPNIFPRPSFVTTYKK
ncbi:antibiotic biosynthesis monooxygenase [Sporosarcina sp. GW1-11]|uniref:antibiotic biosynthesis monooxygenase family protein n=1 Tax=Sporosarcina sp. GW1-11 TaxID=2899126 RepID=UPI00294EF8D0|nr:antibiotic biosynthesis monooxygenase [Sporosarcina sp. GW1-11]MDV6378341.1 antibiotic biosynthesis monooxygenase [Sporosarcina sp. GW1-11]